MFGLSFSSSITLRPRPTFGRSKHHLDLDLKRASPNVIKCSNFSTADALKKVDLKLSKVVKEEIKSFVKPQVPKDLPFEVEDVPDRRFINLLKLKRQDEGERFEVAVFLPEDIDITDIEEHPHYGEPLPLFVMLHAYMRKEDGQELVIYWVGDRDPNLRFPLDIAVNGVNLDKEERDRFDWREPLRARGVDDSILTDFAIDYMKFRSNRKRLFTLEKFHEFIDFEFKA